MSSPYSRRRFLTDLLCVGGALAAAAGLAATSAEAGTPSPSPSTTPSTSPSQCPSPKATASPQVIEPRPPMPGYIEAAPRRPSPGSRPVRKPPVHIKKGPKS